jgi:hypothetical protein
MECNTNYFCSQTLTTGDENAESFCDNDTNLSQISVQNIENVLPSRPATMSKFIYGVRFISTSELKLVDKQREKYPLMKWFTEDKQKKVKPSQQWFKNHQWLRAICTENRYGLLCIDCAEFATNKSSIERNDGAFVVRPYWKLKHKGLDGTVWFL